LYFEITVFDLQGEFTGISEADPENRASG
jgi:hypothetical protein